MPAPSSRASAGVTQHILEALPPRGSSEQGAPSYPLPSTLAEREAFSALASGQASERPSWTPCPPQRTEDGLSRPLPASSLAKGFSKTPKVCSAAPAPVSPEALLVQWG